MADALASGKTPQNRPGKDDAFVEGTFRLAKWAQENVRTVIVGVAGIAIAVLGILYYVNFRASVSEQAATELAALRLTAIGPEQVIPDLQGYIQRFDGTPAADEARLILARSYLDTDRAAEAGQVASAVTEGADRPVGLAARRLLAAAQEAEGNVEGALATFEALGRDARFGFQRRQANASAARLLVQLGRLDEAAAIYTAAAEEAADEDPAEAGVYRLRLGEIRGRQTSG